MPLLFYQNVGRFGLLPWAFVELAAAVAGSRTGLALATYGVDSPAVRRRVKRESRSRECPKNMIVAILQQDRRMVTDASRWPQPAVRHVARLSAMSGTG